jgi:hypothetical protein
MVDNVQKHNNHKYFPTSNEEKEHNWKEQHLLLI